MTQHNTTRSPQPRAALYLRVSDRRGHIDNQRDDLLRMAEGRGLEVVAEFTDEGESAWVAGSVDTRPGLSALHLGAHRGEFSTVLIWALDRLTREGAEVAFRTVRHLKESGVELLSFSEPALSLSGVAGDVVVAVSASYAQAYSDRLSARVRRGMERAGARGVHLGRRREVVDEVEIAGRREAGASIRTIATEMNLSRSMVERRLKRMEEE